MRFLGSALMLALALLASAAHADPASFAAPRKLGAEESARVRFGAALHWLPERLGHRVGLGVGWTLPQRWYDVDGQLLTERSLLNPGEDLERSGFYLALRF